MVVMIMMNPYHIVLAAVPPGNILHFFPRIRDNVIDRSLPAVLINQWRIDNVVRRIDMEPLFLIDRVHLRPDVIKRSEYKACIVTQTSAEKREAIGIFSAATASRLQQLHHIVVSIESCLCAATFERFDAHTTVDVRVLGMIFFDAAHFAWHRIDPREKFLLKPACQFHQQKISKARIILRQRLV